jgi:hypothetical protein
MPCKKEQTKCVENVKTEIFGNIKLNTSIDKSR